MRRWLGVLACSLLAAVAACESDAMSPGAAGGTTSGGASAGASESGKGGSAPSAGAGAGGASFAGTSAGGSAGDEPGGAGEAGLAGNGAVDEPQPDPSPEEVALNTMRATASWQALVDEMGAEEPGQFVDHEGATAIAYVWPQGQIAAAALDLARLSLDGTWFDHTMNGLALYELGPAYAPAIHPVADSELYFDDNGMAGLQLLQSLAQTGNEAYSARAKETFEFILTGEADGGGVYWGSKDARKQRGISASGSATELALRLYLLTKEQRYLDFALRTYAWIEEHLRAPDGYYYNSLYDDGELVTWMFSYNQGYLIGSDALLFRATGDRRYLEHGRAVAEASLAYFEKDDGFWTQPPCFNAIFFRNLLAFDHFAHDERYRAAAAAYAERAWSSARDENGLFSAGGVGSYSRLGVAEAIDQAAFVQLFALLAWPAAALPDAG